MLKVYTTVRTRHQGVAGLMTPCGEFTGHPLIFGQRSRSVPCHVWCSRNGSFKISRTPLVGVMLVEMFVYVPHVVF